jgi:hypothetical protein
VLYWEVKNNRVTRVHHGFDESGVLRARLVQQRSHRVTNLKLYCPPQRLVQTLRFGEVARARSTAEEYLQRDKTRRGG